jgi:hypothetical protein
LGNPSLKGHVLIVDHNATNIVDNNNLLETKGKNLVVEFDASGAHNRLVG